MKGFTHEKEDRRGIVDAGLPAYLGSCDSPSYMFGQSHGLYCFSTCETINNTVADQAFARSIGQVSYNYLICLIPVSNPPPMHVPGFVQFMLNCARPPSAGLKRRGPGVSITGARENPFGRFSASPETP